MNIENKTMEYLFHVEKQAETILVDKSEIIALDKIRNNNRMAIRALMNCKVPQEKTWMAIGPCLVKVSCDKAKNMLLEEQVNLDSRINILRNNMRVNVQKLRDMEYKEPVKGLFLNPITKKEMETLGLDN